MKIFNQVEFDMNINRIYTKDLPTGSNTNLCKRPIHYKYVPNRNNQNQMTKIVEPKSEIPAPAPSVNKA